MPKPFFCLIFTGGLLSALACAAEQVPDEPAAYALHGQTTLIRQFKPAFQAPYTGTNSLVPQKEYSYSFTATVDLGLRLWEGAQVHLNPELVQGVPLSNLTGAGGLSNGELARTSGPHLKMYRARLFLLQRFNAGGETEALDAEFNELGGAVSSRRWTLVVGNFSLLDFFDSNPYAKDPRSQFFNWAFMSHGAWDYAADARGYTSGVMLEYRTPVWALRAARTMQPIESNGLRLDTSLGARYGEQVEFETDLPLRLPAGPLRGSALWFNNRAIMGNYAEALAQGGTPDVGQVRRLQNKTGWGLSLLAPLDEDSGLFLRSSRNDGKSETYAFTEIDRQFSVGGQGTGARWGRAADRWGVALAVHELSPTHRAYLAAGGLGFFLGDGKLNYAPERVFEAWYRWTLPGWNTRAGKVESALSAGWQHLRNPGYNQDRGPAQVYSLRWHSEF